MSPKPPALNPLSVEPRTTSGYPTEEFRERVTPREKRPLGDALGLKQFGVNLTTLYPGKESSLRHYHTFEDEFVFVLSGELILRTDHGDQELKSGMCAGFPAGTKNGHQLINQSPDVATYLEIGSRIPNETVGYSDVDLSCFKDSSGKWIFTRKNGSAY
jgi:uncharacterized cupin superfamily protein